VTRGRDDTARLVSDPNHFYIEVEDGEEEPGRAQAEKDEVEVEDSRIGWNRRLSHNLKTRMFLSAKRLQLHNEKSMGK
jgi:hypothetical protein